MVSNLRKLLFLFPHLLVLQLVISAPTNVFENGILQNRNNIKPKDDDDDCDEDDDDCPCEEYSDMCGRKFWTITAVIIGVVLLLIMTIIVAIVIVILKRNKNKSARRPETQTVPKQLTTPQVEVTPPRLSLPNIVPANSNNKANTHENSTTVPSINRSQQYAKGNDERPTAPSNPDYENIRQVDEPPPPYDFAESSNSNNAVIPETSQFRWKELEANTSSFTASANY